MLVAVPAPSWQLEASIVGAYWDSVGVVNDQIYRVKDLRLGFENKAYRSRLWLFSEKKCVCVWVFPNVSEDLRRVIEFKAVYEVESFLDVG